MSLSLEKRALNNGVQAISGLYLFYESMRVGDCLAVSADDGRSAPEFV